MFILNRERKGIRGAFLKIKNLKLNRKFKNKKGLKQIEEIEIFVEITKVIFKLFAFIFLPTLMFAVIIIAVILAIWHWFWPWSTNSNISHITTFLSYQSQFLQSSKVGGSFVDSVLEAVSAVLYIFFIKPILWVLGSFQVIIVYMSSGGLLNEFLFGNKSTIFHVPKSFVIVSGIAIGLMTLFLILKMIEVMNAKHNVKAMKFKSGVNNVFIAIIGVCFIPIMFIILNTLIVGITQIIANAGNLTTTDLGLTVFNSSFTNGIHHFTYVPDSWTFEDSGNFSYIVCIISELFVCYSMFLIGIMLIWNAFEILILFCISPLPIAWCIEDESKRFRAWKEVTVARFINIAIIFLTYTIFISSLSVFSKIAGAWPNSSARPIFVMLGLFAGVTAVIKAPVMLSGVLGNHSMALSDGLSTIIGMKAVSGGIKTTAGAILFGSKNKRLLMARHLGDKSNLINTSGGLLGAGRNLKYGISNIKDNNEKLKTVGIVAGATVGAFTGSIVGSKPMSLRLQEHIALKRSLKSSDSEQCQRQEIIKDGLIDNIHKTAEKLKNINNNQEKKKRTKNKEKNSK